MHSYYIRRYELRIKFKEHIASLWLLLSDSNKEEGEEMYIAYQEEHQEEHNELNRFLNIEFSEYDRVSLVKISLLMKQFQEKQIGFNELMNINKLLNSGISFNN